MSEEMIETMEKVDSEVMTEEEIKKLKKARRHAIWDKITTGILIFLMVLPILILAFIFLRFIFK